MDDAAARKTLLNAGRKAMSRIDALGKFEASQDGGSEELLLHRADVVEAARDALLEALNRFVDCLQDEDARR